MTTLALPLQSHKADQTECRRRGANSGSPSSVMCPTEGLLRTLLIPMPLQEMSQAQKRLQA